MIKYTFYIILTFFVASCSHPSNNIIKEENTEYANKYAKGFKILESKNHFLIEVFNLQNDSSATFYQFSKSEIKKTKKVAAFSDNHIGAIDLLQEIESVVGIGQAKHVYHSDIKQGVKEGRVHEIGGDLATNYEELMKVNPDVVFISGFKNIENTLNKFERADVKPVIINDWMEAHPLAKAEWIKVFGLIYGKLDVAVKYFDEVEKKYLALKQITDAVTKKSDILAGYDYNGIWYMPGGKSYLTQFFLDAGGGYQWKDDGNAGSISLNLEEVLSRHINSDVWIHSGNYSNLNELVSNNDKYALFDAVKNKRVYSSIKRTHPDGGNDYWETGILNPHIVLKDLILILHPGLISGETYYYKKLD